MKNLSAVSGCYFKCNQVKFWIEIKDSKKNIDWEHVFETRNVLNDLHFNPENPLFYDWQQDIPNIQNELVITP